MGCGTMAGTGTKCLCRGRERVDFLGVVAVRLSWLVVRWIVVGEGTLVAAAAGSSSSVEIVDDRRLTGQACSTSIPRASENVK